MKVIIYYEKDCDVYGIEVNIVNTGNIDVKEYTPKFGRYITHICIEEKRV